MSLMNVFLFSILLSVSAFAQTGKTVSGNFSNDFGSRGYQIYTPKHLATNAGLLVVLHGCFQTGDQMATGAEFNKYADERGFAVLYPEQSYMDNSWKCWNWFKPENQKRDGELSIIAGMSQKMVGTYKLDAKKVYIAGMSAGGAMVANALACYSDVFSGGLIHSGLEYAAAQTESEAHDIMKPGPNHDLDQVAKAALACSPSPKAMQTVIVVHGQADSSVGTVNADRNALLFEKINTVIFQSQGGSLQKITHDQSVITQDGYKYSADVYDTLFDSKLTIRKIMVKDMGHAWSGGQPTAPYMEPRGIKATQALVDTFFPVTKFSGKQ